MATKATKAEQKEELIDLLIDNTEYSGFSEDDREDLEAMTLGGLQNCVALAEKTANIVDNAKDYEEDEEDGEPMKKARKGKKKMTKNTAEEDEDEEEEIPVENKKKKKGLVLNDKKSKKLKPKSISVLQTNKEEDEEDEELTDNEEQESLEEYLESAPPAFREMLVNGAKTFQQQRKNLIDIIMNCETNKFERAWLASQELEVLQGLVHLTQNNKRHSRPDYTGAAGSARISPLRNTEEEGLSLPTMNFASKN